MSKPRWHFWIDQGGTFTDCIACTPTGERHVTKVRSEPNAPLVAIRSALRLPADAPIPPCEVRLGTTIATNALLERRGTATGLLTNAGFEDILAIDDQTRPELFSLHIPSRRPLPHATRGIDARRDAHGAVVTELNEEQVRGALRELRDAGCQSLAVSLLHACRNGTHERAVAELARDEGFVHVALGHEVDHGEGFLLRTSTTVADAYLTPTIHAYLGGLLAELPGSTLLVMQSHGGLAPATRVRGRDLLLSGPAGGGVAVAHLAKAAGVERAIGFDMGGTSTDVCRYDGAIDVEHETRIAGVRVRAPSVAIHTVAAGGGSVCTADERRFTVGPESVGAMPGPLAYGHPDRHHLAVTDANVVLGRVLPEHFPFALDASTPRQRLQALGQRLGWSAERVAQGFFDVAVESMARAIRQVTTARGHDAREHALVVFGGAGGQHACAVANRLGIRTLIIHPLAGVLSAYGIGMAEQSETAARDLGAAPLTEAQLGVAEAAFDQLRTELAARLQCGGEALFDRELDLRYRGSSTSITIAWRGLAELRAHFEREHERVFGYLRPGHAIEMTTARARMRVPTSRVGWASDATSEAPVARTTQSLWLAGKVTEFSVFHRADFGPGTRVEGPAIILEGTSTTVVEPGWAGERLAEGILRLDALDQPHALPPTATPEPGSLDPVALEVFAHRIMAIAEQMGTVLQRTALSTNIRDRLDFSCAVFNPSGDLVANAPHIPVHLGAMAESVRAVIAAHPDAKPGDAFATNDPAAGGSHLPDITVVSPVYVEGSLRFFVASRGHHADIGGKSPGSMPAFADCLEDEEVVLRAVPVARAGEFDATNVARELSRGHYPARRPHENIADLKAQVAANEAGSRALRELCRQQGVAHVERAMTALLNDADAAIREAITTLPEAPRSFADRLDDGRPIIVTIQRHGDRLTLDFTGTAPESDDNLNAPRAVTVAAVLYALRTLVGRPIPLNEGCLRSVDLVIPPRSLLDPSPERAVSGGNVETSQRVVDVMLGAFGLAAASQGTMNNVAFGGAGYGYYETLGGGAGAGPDFDGASAVHTHMTNTRVTDAEVLESRFPVRLRRFALRPASGGAGHTRGGDGLIREYEFLERTHVTLLTQRRETSPFGLAGGEPGTPGRNLLDDQPLAHRAEFEADPGQRVCVETPGGGGYGPKGGAASEP